MKTLISLFAAACLITTAFAQQPAAQKKTGAENQNLNVWYGEWTYVGTSVTTPLGPGYQYTGRMTGRPVLDGFAGEFTYEEKGPAGEHHYLEIDFWDPGIKAYRYIFLGDDGYVERGSFTMKGGVTSFEGAVAFEGKIFKGRGVETLAGDGLSLIKKFDLCADGKTWLPYVESKYTKVIPEVK